MEFKQLEQKALGLRKKLVELQKHEYGREWTNEEIYMGLVGDIGDLGKFIMTKEGRRSTKDGAEKLSDELMDCLWSVIVLANKFDINIEKSFEKMIKNAEEKYNLEKSE